MSFLLISRLILTFIIIVISYFALVRVWTSEIDIIAFLKKPSESIPLKEPRKPEISGVLTPSNKPTPSSKFLGNIPSNAFTLFLGNSVAYTNTFPHTVIKVENEQLLVINKEYDKITVSAKFYSKDGKIVAELKDNNFYINPNNYFRIERPNAQ